jgi:hypothetical protein
VSVREALVVWQRRTDFLAAAQLQPIAFAYGKLWQIKNSFWRDDHGRQVLAGTKFWESVAVFQAKGTRPASHKLT